MLLQLRVMVCWRVVTVQLLLLLLLLCWVPHRRSHRAERGGIIILGEWMVWVRLMVLRWLLPPLDLMASFRQCHWLLVLVARRWLLSLGLWLVLTALVVVLVLVTMLLLRTGEDVVKSV